MKKLFTFILIILLHISCSDIIEYSPYQVKVNQSQIYLNQENLIRIQNLESTDLNPFKIVLISDTHTEYDDLNHIIIELNKRDDYDFIINIGDITESGLYKEYKWYSDIIKTLNKPIITVIGNHDCRSNGKYIYDEMFGNPNFTFEYNNCKFIIFNDIIWGEDLENPDFEWFNTSLHNDKQFNHVIPFSHIPPWDGQFSYANEMTFNYILDNNNITYSFHGHDHHFSVRQPYKDILGNVVYTTIENIKKRTYFLLTIEKDNIKIEKVNI